MNRGICFTLPVICVLAISCSEQPTPGPVNDTEAHETIDKQREQLQLLCTRIRRLMTSNQELELTNKKTYEDMESAVRKIAPLRSQITDLENLQESLQRYIRQKHDRTFTVGKLKE